MSLLPRLLGPWMVLAVASCSGPSAYLKTDTEPWLRYERTPCFGPCPAFLLEVDSKGQARFNGRRNVTLEGVFKGQWNDADLQRVAEAAHAVALKDKAGIYDNPMVTDLPTKRILLSDIVFVDRIDAPPVDRLYAVLDSLISSTGWTPEGL